MDTKSKTGSEGGKETACDDISNGKFINIGNYLTLPEDKTRGRNIKDEKICPYTFY